MSWPHPSALCQQQRILAGQSRFPPARSREEDNSSVLSWKTAQNESDDPADGEDPLLVNEGMVSMGINRLDPISEAPGLLSQLRLHQLCKQPETLWITRMRRLSIAS